MGIQYSAGMLLPELRFLTQRNLAVIEARLLKHHIHCPSALLSKSDIQSILRLSETEMFQVLHAFDYRLQFKVSALDLLGAIALGAAEDLETKLRFLFVMMDSNRDNYLSRVDTEILLFCVCRGEFSLLRSFHFTSCQDSPG